MIHNLYNMKNTMINPRLEESLPDPIVNPCVSKVKMNPQTVRWFMIDHDPIQSHPHTPNDAK
jgi:hypothetical protein